MRPAVRVAVRVVLHTPAHAPCTRTWDHISRRTVGCWEVLTAIIERAHERHANA